MDIANLIIRVTNEGLDRATRELRRLQENAAGAQAANERFGNSIADLNKLAMVGFGALTAVVGGSIKTAIDFEKAMAGVAKTVDFAADNGLANMKKGIEDLTKVIPLAFEELAEIASVGGSLGVVEEDILGFTETIAKMGVAFDISAGDAADSMAKIAGVFGIPIAEISALGDSINAVSNSVAASAGDVIDFMKRVGGTSAALKISADNTSALGGAMVALGLTPEVAATAFNTLGITLAGFNNLTSTQARGFKRLGLDTVEFADLIQTDAVAAIHQLLGATKELGGTDALTALTEAFGAQGIKILQVAEGLDTVDLALSQVAIGADGVSAAFGSMDAEFASVSGTTANKLQLVQNNMRLLAAGVGEAFLPAVNEMILALVPVIEKMTAWAQANPELVVTIAKVAAAITGTIIVVAAISAAIGTAISIFTGLSAIFALVAGEAAILAIAISSPLVIIGLLIAAGIALYMNWDLVKKKASELGAWIATVWNKIKWDILQAVTSAKESAIAKFNELKTAAVNKMNAMADSIVNALKALPSKMLQIGKDIVMGLINGIKSGASGVASAIGSMASSAVAKAKSVLDIRSPSRVMKKVGEQTAEGMAVGIKKGAKAVKSEAQKMAEQAIETVKNSIASLQKEIALFGNDSPLASFNFDVGVGKFAGVPDSLLDKNRELITQKMRLIELDKQQAESVKLLAKARESIQERFAKLKTDQKASGKAVDGVMGELQAETAIGKIQADYERRIEVIRKHEELTTGLIGSEEAKRIAIYESAQKAKELIQIQGNEKLFGELSSITKTFFGEQSAAHKAMFAVEKYFALKRILVENKVALAKAWASAAFPYNLPAVATVAAQTGLLAAAVKGFKQGGYTGNMGASQVAGVVHGQEYVFDAQSTKRIGVDNLNAMRSGKSVGGDVQVNIINNSSARVTASDDGQTITIEDVRNENKRSWTNLSNPNSFESKQVNRNIQAPRRR